MSSNGSKTNQEHERRAKLPGARLAWGVLLLPFAAAAPACTSTEVTIGADCENGFCVDAGAPPPSFTPPPSTDGGEAGATLEPPEKLLACVGTECPYPYASCSKTPSAVRCETNLMNDPANCGECGVTCEGFSGINMTASCVQGKCLFECMIKQNSNGYAEEYRDCNGLLDDGCEANLGADPDNCGACGNKCAPGENCIKGRCGCPNGMLDCGGTCVDDRFNNSNCGACGNSCRTPSNACSPMPFQTSYGCVMRECGKLKCRSGYADCNGDLNQGCASDGCEVQIAKDPNNCGGCGIQCGPGQECRDDGLGPQCLDPCTKSGLTQCTSGCKDLLSDRFNCGGCNVNCGNPRANQEVSCKKGMCAIECLPGFADCNGDPNDGCEVNLRTHPGNCGACGNQCDVAAGQPCIEGKCLMIECDGGVEVPK